MEGDLLTKLSVLLKTELSTFKEELTGKLDTELSTFKEELTGKLDTELSTFKGKLDNVQRDVADINTNVATLERDVADINTNVATLERRQKIMASKLGLLYEHQARVLIEHEFGREFSKPFRVKDTSGLCTPCHDAI